MSKKFEKALEEISESREDVVAKLVQFSQTDALLFWSHNDSLAQRQLALWGPLVVWARELLRTEIVTTKELDVPAENIRVRPALKLFLESLSDRELTALYLWALTLRSVILAMALLKKKITPEQAYDAGWLEELWQAEKWGVDSEAEDRRMEMKREVMEVWRWVQAAGNE